MVNRSYAGIARDGSLLHDHDIGTRMRTNTRAFTLVEIMLVVCIIGLLATVAIPACLKSAERVRTTACFDNMRAIEMAKTMWANDNCANDGDIVTMDDIVPYLKKTPYCASGGAYIIGCIGSNCYCTVHDWRTIPAYSSFRP